VRDFILSEIKRLAAENGGSPPGREVFTRTTGITPGKWTGVYWVRWGDALAEAGFARNEWTQKRDSREILEHIALLTRSLGRLPTRAEIKMHKRWDPSFPTHSTVGNHFRTNDDLVSALRLLALEHAHWSDLLGLLPEPPISAPTRSAVRLEGGDGLPS
jgi:hypothetical protein